MGFSHGRTNPQFAAAVEANSRYLDASRRVAEAKADGKKARKEGDAIAASNADLRESGARVEREGAFEGLLAAEGDAVDDRGHPLFDPKRALEEAGRRLDREEQELIRDSAGSGDVGAARTARANERLATGLRDRATVLSATVASARQGDRERSANAALLLAKADAKAAERQGPEAAKAAKEVLEKRRATLERTRREARSPAARREFARRCTEARALAKAARRAAQAARKAARREKNAARYGPPSAVAKAQADALRLQGIALAAQKDAEDAANRLLDPESPLLADDAEGGATPGDDKPGDCACSPPCPWFSECRCQCVPGEDSPPTGGNKGRLGVNAKAVAPPDSGVGPQGMSGTSNWPVIGVTRMGAGDSQGEEEISSAQPSRPTPPPPQKKRERKPPKKGIRGRDWRPDRPLLPVPPDPLHDFPSRAPDPLLEPPPPPGMETTTPPPRPMPPAPPSGPKVEFAKRAAQTVRMLQRDLDWALRSLQKWGRAAQQYFRILASGQELTQAQEARFEKILYQAHVDELAADFISRQIDRAKMTALAGLSDDASERKAATEGLDALEQAGRNARKVVVSGLQELARIQEAEARARRDAGRSYTDADLDNAGWLLARAWKGERAALDQLRDLGFSRGIADLNAGRVAVEFFRIRRDAEMKSADEATSLWSLVKNEVVSETGEFLDGVVRGLQAVEKLTESAVTLLQTANTTQIAATARLLKSVGLDIPFLSPETFEELAKSQAKSFQGSLEDSWRFLINKDLHLVRDRILEGTLGTVSVAATADEHAAGLDPMVEFLRGAAHVSTAGVRVSVNYLLGGAPGGGLTGASMVASATKALGALRAFGGAAWRGAPGVAARALQTPKMLANEAKAAIRRLVSGHVAEGGAKVASVKAAQLGGGRVPVALDTSAYYSLFDTPRRKADAWNEVVTGLLSGRDLRIPESMLRELTTKSGLSRAEVLRNLESVAGSVSVLPEGAFATRAALKEAGLAGRGWVWDRRNAASAIDLKKMFGTGDWDQARAAVDVLEKALGSRELARQHILWLRPIGIPGLKGRDPRNLAILFAAGLGAAARTSDEPVPRHSAQGSS